MLNTGHPVFDYLCPLNRGESALILDGTPTGAIRFLMGVLANRERNLEVHMISTRSIDPPPGWNCAKLDLHDLTEVQILVNKVKENIREGVIIHYYLPELLTLFDEKSVLKFLEVMKQRSQKGIFEFYIISLNAFESFEKKVMSIVPFVIELSVREVDSNPLHRLIIRKNPYSDYGLMEYPYITHGGRTLIKFGGTYSENITALSTENINARLEKYKASPTAYRVKVAPGRGKPLEFFDHELLATINEKTFSDVEELFPEDIDGIFKRIFLLEEEELVHIENVKDAIQLSSRPRVKKIPSTLLGDSALKFPVGISKRLLRTPTDIPLDIYRSLLGVFIDFLRYVFKHYKISPSDEDLKTYIDNACFRIAEINCRLTTVQRLKEMKEDTRAVMDIKYIPKIIKLTLAVLADVNAEVTKLTDSEYKIIVRDNPFVIKPEGGFPSCSIIRGGIVGALSVCVKRKTYCEELRCKAKNDPYCEFRCRID